jgi:hypothetical protein
MTMDGDASAKERSWQGHPSRPPSPLFLAQAERAVSPAPAKPAMTMTAAPAPRPNHAAFTFTGMGLSANMADVFLLGRPDGSTGYADRVITNNSGTIVSKIVPEGYSNALGIGS